MNVNGVITRLGITCIRPVNIPSNWVTRGAIREHRNYWRRHRRAGAGACRARLGAKARALFEHYQKVAGSR